jgi:repressor LexA
MVKEGILDGDYIIVHARTHAENGETVVALVRGDATVKRFYREKAGMVRLQPANDQMEPILARASDVEIRGIVVAVMRKYVPVRRRTAA